jgi:hypothetical protein
VALKKHDFGSRERLASELALTYTPAPTVVQLGGDEPVVGWSQYVQPMLLPLHGVRQPHVFAFVRKEDGEVGLLTKRWSRESSWLGDEESKPIG